MLFRRNDMFCGLPRDKEHIALFIVRITLGVIFIMHGSQKVFGLFGGPGLQGFAVWAAQAMGLSPFLAYLAAFAELIGGVLLLLGIAAELGALMTIPVMLGAAFILHWPHGFFSQNGGYDFPLSLALFAFAIVIGGPGKFALWKPVKKICAE